MVNPPRFLLARALFLINMKRDCSRCVRVDMTDQYSSNSDTSSEPEDSIFLIVFFQVSNNGDS